MDETIIECLQIWTFMDAFATLYLNRDSKIRGFYQKSYWRRIKGMEVEIRQALEYGCSLINELTGGGI